MITSVRNYSLKNFLDDKPAFDVNIETDTRISKQRKLLLGVHNATEIDRILPTVASYSIERTRILRASYLIDGPELSGIGVIDEWREFPTDPFNVYGFDYDVEFDDIRFRLGTMTHDANRTSLVEVKTPYMSPTEHKKLGALCMSKAFVDLTVNKQLLVPQH